MVRRKTHEEFVAEVEALYGDEYTVLGQYVKSDVKITMCHNKCECTFDVRPSNFTKNKTRCPRCFGTPRKTTEEFAKEVHNSTNGEYTLVSEYLRNFKKVIIRHNKCGREYEVTPINFQKGNRCARCSNRIKRDTNSFSRLIKDLSNNEYEVIGKYVNTDTKITIKHNICGHAYEVRPANFIHGKRCPNCFGTPRKTTEEFTQEVFELVGNTYSVLGEYVNNHTKIKIRHNECSYEYKARPSDLLNGSRCPKCNESKGERAVAESLAKLRTPYIRQHKFDDCRNIKRLPFDFAVFNADRLPRCLIEYDGVQHFKPVDHFGGEKGFSVRKHCDAIKTQYCSDNNIPLIRIPYWDFDNIDEILTKELRKLGVIGTQDIAA